MPEGTAETTTKPEGTAKTATDEAKEKLRSATEDKDVWAILQKAIANLISLEIKTIVTEDTEAEELFTRIDLLQADRTNKIHKNFLKGADLTPLRDFHAEQVKLAEADIQRKIDFLERMGEAIIKAMNKQKS